jgi:diadenosine tetraphosphatase ApaH/serine/threonine PP2A family protein phosphatase
VHANRQAWRAVLTDISSLGVDQILCLGDIVGYGPDPADVLEDVYVHVHHFVLGNHDAAVCGRASTAAFNPDAKTIVEWTRAQLDAKAVAFFRSLPLVLRGAGFRCAHANLASPGRFTYLIEADDALPSFQACPEQLMFVGHSHLPGIFVVGQSGTSHLVEAQDFNAEPAKRYIVNVGSVGQPRDHDMRACYCLFDQERGDVQFRRVPFDVDAFRAALVHAQLPLGPSHVLRVAEQQAPRPIRELLDFHPEDSPDSDGGEGSVKELEGAVRSARRWRRFALTATVCFLSALVGAGLWLRAMRARQVVAAALEAEPLACGPAQAGTEMLVQPGPAGTVSRTHRLQTWTVRLADPARQSVRVEEMPGKGPRGSPEPCFRLSSADLLPLSVESRPLVAEAGARYVAKARTRKTQWSRGSLELTLVHAAGDGTERVVARSELPGTAPEGQEKDPEVTETWQDAGGGALRLQVSGRFVGVVEVWRCSLKRRP